MNYTMRFIKTDASPISNETLGEGLRSSEDGYRLVDGKLIVGGNACAQIEILRDGDSGFAQEIDGLRKLVQHAAGRGKRRVSETIDGSQALIVVRVLWEECEPEETLQKIDPLWAWLFDNHEGLIQADDEGFYERTRRILSVEAAA